MAQLFHLFPKEKTKKKRKRKEINNATKRKITTQKKEHKQNNKTTKQQNNKTTKQQNNKTTKQQNKRKTKTKRTWNINQKRGKYKVSYPNLPLLKKIEKISFILPTSQQLFLNLMEINT